MPNFKLVFATESIEDIKGKRIVREGPALNRIISAYDDEIAGKIAEAMLGEEVYPTPSLYLGQVLRVVKTNLMPDINSICDSYTWERVLWRLRFYLDEKISGQEMLDGFKLFSKPVGMFSMYMEKVGLKLNKAQRTRLCSINL